LIHRTRVGGTWGGAGPGSGAVRRLGTQNIDPVADVLGLAEEVGADRVELANTQYYGWAWRNRGVIPDYYSRYPKPCMGGWVPGS
jgi:hypothetical protein